MSSSTHTAEEPQMAATGRRSNSGQRPIPSPKAPQIHQQPVVSAIIRTRAWDSWLSCMTVLLRPSAVPSFALLAAFAMFAGACSRNGGDAIEAVGTVEIREHDV